MMNKATKDLKDMDRLLSGPKPGTGGDVAENLNSIDINFRCGALGVNNKWQPFCLATVITVYLRHPKSEERW